MTTKDAVFVQGAETGASPVGGDRNLLTLCPMCSENLGDPHDNVFVKHLLACHRKPALAA